MYADNQDDGLSLTSLTSYQDSPDGGGGGSSKDMFNLFGGIAKAVSGFQSLNAGADMAMDGANFQAGIYRESGKAALQGAQFQADVYRQSGHAATIAANYNIALDERATARQQGALARQIGGAISKNYGTAAATGIGIGSKSTMMVQNEVISTGERQSVQMRNDALQRQSLIDYQGKLTVMQYENQARASEYSGAVAVQEAENKARSAIYQGQVDAYKMKQQASDQLGGSVMNMFGSMMGGG